MIGLLADAGHDTDTVVDEGLAAPPTTPSSPPHRKPDAF
jgi:hypothetical protein